MRGSFYALNVNLQTNVHFEWVKSEANIADMPTRNSFGLLQEFGSTRAALTIPPMSSWRTPGELHKFAQGAALEPGMPLPRAGRPTARAVETVKASAPLQTAARRPLVVVVVVVAATPNYLGQASQNLGKYSLSL